MPVAIELTPAGGVPVRIWTENIEPGALRQLENVARLPFVFHHVAAMPDVHEGKGATIGSVIATKGAVIPAAVGVDIGCGMLLQKTTLTRNDVSAAAAREIFDALLRRIPVGFTQREKKDVCHEAVYHLALGMQEINSRTPGILNRMTGMNWRRQIGTLGGGNHFIELTADETGALWLMIHSGSRGAGNVMADWFIRAARKETEARGEVLPNMELSYFTEGTEFFEHYLFAAHWAQDYAKWNRRAMLTSALAALSEVLPQAAPEGDFVDCHHNYVARETHFGEEVWVTRKGAISAAAGEPGIVPGSMGAASYLVEGLGSEDSFMSSAHGAGRAMGRREATRRYSVEDLVRQTEGVLCRKDAGVLDEIPAAYKPIDEVMACQADLTRTVHRYRQILCVKG